MICGMFGNGVQKFQRFKAKKSKWHENDSESTTSPSESTGKEMIDYALTLKYKGRHIVAVNLLEYVANSGDQVSKQVAAYELAVLHSQLGNHAAADVYLQRLDFSIKLANSILCPEKLKMKLGRGNQSGKSCPATDRTIHKAVVTFDNVLPAYLLQPLQAAFSPSSPFWTQHNYPTDEFFSYNVKQNGASSLMTQLVDHLTPLIMGRFPKFQAPSPGCSMEWWCHMRDNTSGFAHQLHFDLDEAALRDYNTGERNGRTLKGTKKQEGGIRNMLHPSISAVLYLSEQDDAAPTLVTDQTLDAGSVASEAWLCHPAQNRLLLFDGKFLHGVVPFLPSTEKSASKTNKAPSKPRITLMMGFWEKEFSNSKVDSNSARINPTLGPNMVMPPTSHTIRSKQSSKANDASSSKNMKHLMWPSLLAPVKLIVDGADNKSHNKYHSDAGLVHIPGPIWVNVGSAVASDVSPAAVVIKSSLIDSASKLSDCDFISAEDLKRMREAPSVGVSDDEDDDGHNLKKKPKKVIIKEKSSPEATISAEYGEAVEFISIAELNKLRSAMPVESSSSKKKIKTTHNGDDPGTVSKKSSKVNGKVQINADSNDEMVFVGKWFLKSLSEIRDDVLQGTRN